MKSFFAPNITTPGRLFRGLVGLLLLVAAGFGLQVHWTACLLLGIAGVFCLFEAARGWCLARACGVKTRW